VQVVGTQGCSIHSVSKPVDNLFVWQTGGERSTEALDAKLQAETDEANEKYELQCT